MLSIYTRMNSTRTPYDKDAYNISQRPKYLVSKIMSLVDDNKEKLQENDYLDMCKFLKSVYELDDEEEVPNLVFKMELNIYIKNILLEVLDEPLAKQLQFVLDSNIVIPIDSDPDNVFNDIDGLLVALIIDNMSFETSQKLIEQFGCDTKKNILPNEEPEVYNRNLVLRFINSSLLNVYQLQTNSSFVNYNSYHTVSFVKEQIIMMINCV